MNLVYGEVVDQVDGDGLELARINVGGVIKKASIGLLTGVKIGDTVLLCDGVAIARVTDSPAAESLHKSLITNHEHHVSGNSR
jgi:hydrogenase maturation factor